MERCRRCVALGIKPPGIARDKGCCNWCLQMADEDNRLRELKGKKVYYI